jgi:hypothetical protein
VEDEQSEPKLVDSSQEENASNKQKKTKENFSLRPLPKGRKKEIFPCCFKGERSRRGIY